MARDRVWIVFSVLVGLLVPLAIYLLNGALAPWMFVLGATIGFSLWYFKLPLL
jgi:hypothetical protein